MKIAIGCDHGGIVLKPEIMEYLTEKGYDVLDFGTYSDEATDYAVYAQKVAEAVTRGDADFGILMCGTGIGISIAANKVPGVRCALLSDAFSAQATREHNNANIMAMGGRTTGPGLAVMLVDIFLHTEFSQADRHQKRIDQIKELEQKYNK